MIRNPARSALAATLLVLACCPAGGAHGGGAAKGYASTITAITPVDPALHVAVLDADDRLEVRVSGDHVVVVQGYEGEPYLRFAPTGVFQNARSPATYLNDDRYGQVELPDQADADAAPAWKRVAPAGRAFDWHDHRIHWMSTSYPPKIEADKSSPHHVFDWTVPGTLDGAALEIRGSLDYEPLPGQGFPRLLLVPLGLLLALSIGLVVLRHRRSRSG